MVTTFKSLLEFQKDRKSSFWSTSDFYINHLGVLIFQNLSRHFGWCNWQLKKLFWKFH